MEENPTRICELLVGLGDVEVLGVEDACPGMLLWLSSGLLGEPGHEDSMNLLYPERDNLTTAELTTGNHHRGSTPKPTT